MCVSRSSHIKAFVLTLWGALVFTGCTVNDAILGTFGTAFGPSIYIDDVTVTEGDTLIFTVSILEPYSEDVSFKWRTVSGTATTTDSDYTSIPLTTITIPAGSLTVQVGVVSTGDTKFENNETFTISLTHASGGQIEDNFGLGTINNDDTAPDIFVTDASVLEGNTAQAIVSLSAVSGVAAAFIYRTFDDVALQSADYTQVISSVRTIPAGSLSLLIPVVSIEDLNDEVDETFLVSLSSVTGASVGVVGDDDLAEITITDDDSAPQIFISDVSVAEGGTLLFIVTLVATGTTNATFDFLTYDVTATLADSDYTSVSASGTIAAGDLSATIAVITTVDTKYEAAETILVSLSNLANTTTGDLLATGTITNNDTPPDFYIFDAEAEEGDSIVFIVSLSEVSGLNVTFNYATLAGTATAGSDYTSASGAFTLLSGELTGGVTIVTIDDVAVEASTENFTLSISSVSGANPVDFIGVGGITSDDSAPPQIFIQAPGAPFTTASSVDLVLLADNGLYTEMYVTNVAGCGSGGVWEAYSSSKSSWGLDPGQLGSTTTVYAKFRDASLNESACVSDSILSISVTSSNMCTVTASAVTYGNFYDNGGPAGNYSNNRNCYLTITAGVPIKMSFSAFDLEAGWDYLTVWNSSVSPATVLGRFTGTLTPAEITADSGTFVVNLLTDGNTVYSGFAASWSPVRPTPNGVFSINNGADYTSSASVTLAVSGLTLPEMYVTNTSGCGSGGSWQALVATRSWTLTAGEGKKTVYIKYRDPYGQETPCENDTIEIYTSNPVVSLSGLPAAVTHDTSLFVTVGGAYISAYKYKIEPGADCSSSSGYSSEISSSTKIVDPLTGFPDGDLTLCVVGSNPAGTYQAYNAATSYTFNYDSMQSISVAQTYERSNEANSSESLTITLSQAKAYDIVVYYDLSGRTAVSGTHYSGIATGGSVTILASQLSTTIDYNLIDNAVTDGEKFIQINLSGANKSAIVIGETMQYRHYIVDNESASSTTAMIAAGSNHTCGTLASGALKCWGNNSNGQLGDTSTTTRLYPTLIDSGVSYTKVTAGSNVHSCGIGPLGAVKCWGLNSNGQLGDNSTTQRSSPAALNDADAYNHVSAGNAHSCGITTTGVLKCWGLNSNNQIGDGTTTQRTSPQTVNGGTTYTKVETANANSCAITSAGVLQCWGLNTNGKLGNGTTNQLSTPTDIDSGTTYADVDLGDSHTCAITTGGELKCWGLNSSGQLGTGNTTNSSSPVVIDSGVSYTSVSAGATHTCAIVAVTGVLKCWGLNSKHQIGNGNNTTVLSPTIIDPGSVYTQVSAGGGHTCGVTGGATKCWGANGSGTSNYGQLGDGIQTQQLTPTEVQSDDTFVKVNMVWGAGCGITTAGVLKCWDENSDGVLGDGTIFRRNAPMIIDPGVTYADISRGSGTTACGITTAGVLKCWGNNSSGQVGDGTTIERWSPVVIDAGTTYSQVAQGYATGCGVTTTGVLKCWGDNSTYQFGDGTLLPSYVPKVIDSGVSYTMVSLQDLTTCGVTSLGVLKCWGYNDGGTVGDGSTSTAPLPVVIDPGVDYSFVATGFYNTCAITTTGVLKCWGLNDRGQVGDGTTTPRNSPVVADAGTTYSYVDLSQNNSSCGITTAGLFKGWGRNNFSQTGDGTTVNPRPTPVPSVDNLTTYSQCQSGNVHAMGLTSAGKIKTWGTTFDNRLGSSLCWLRPGVRPVGFEQ